MKNIVLLVAFTILLGFISCDKLEIANEKLNGTWKVSLIEYADTLYCDSCAQELEFQHCATTVIGCKFYSRKYLDTLVFHSTDTFRISDDVKYIYLGQTPNYIHKLTKKEFVFGSLPNDTTSWKFYLSKK